MYINSYIYKYLSDILEKKILFATNPEEAIDKIKQKEQENKGIILFISGILLGVLGNLLANGIWEYYSSNSLSGKQLLVCVLSALGILSVGYFLFKEIKENNNKILRAQTVLNLCFDESFRNKIFDSHLKKKLQRKSKN